MFQSMGSENQPATAFDRAAKQPWRSVQPMLFAAFLALNYAGAAAPESIQFSYIAAVTGNQASELEQKHAQLLVDRLERAAGVPGRVIPETEYDIAAGGTDRLLVLLGTPARHQWLAEVLRNHKIAPPDAKLDPGAEGFHLEAVTGADGQTMALAAGSDERGVLYAVGELLRRLELDRGAVAVPAGLRVRTAPAFRHRGLEVFQGWPMFEITGARLWTPEEWEEVVLDFALAGANIVSQGDHAFVQGYGLQVMGGLAPNHGTDARREWLAIEPIGRTGGYLCPSIPEARAHLLERHRRAIENWPVSYDFIRMASADPGGCLCENCHPYGGTFIRLCEDIAAIIHEHHPNTMVMFTNQEMCNEDDQAIFDYLNAEPRDWLYAWCYAPGSNAMAWTSARRPDHRMDLFEYPAFGPLERYIREILHQVPPRHSIVFFTDVTHWVRSQYGLVMNHVPPDRGGHLPPHWSNRDYRRQPDPTLFKVYNRRAFFARPRHYHHVFRETMRYGEGDMVYSEGHHDHFNRWLWMRMLWDPHQPLDDLVLDYCRQWFGPEAAPPMAEAIFLMEENLEATLETNPGIDRYLELVRRAGQLMPAWRMERNYVWRMHMQKAYIDKYAQLRRQRQLGQVAQIEQWFTEALDGGDPAHAARQTIELIASDIETGEMKQLRAEAERLDDETDELFGMRHISLTQLDQDLAGLLWYDTQVKRLLEADAGGRERLARLIAHYEDPGPGGYYDNFGEWDDALAPHLAHGFKYSCRHSPNAFSYSNRPSQNTMVFTAEHEQGLMIAYTGLDPEARYRARFSLVRPEYLPRFTTAFEETRGFALHTQTSQTIWADGQVLAADLEIPMHTAELFEFDIPHEATQDGTLTIRFERSSGVGEFPEPLLEVWKNTNGWSTLCSEAWLMRRD